MWRCAWGCARGSAHACAFAALVGTGGRMAQCTPLLLLLQAAFRRVWHGAADSASPGSNMQLG
jgi:hypothetical protein